MRFHVLDKCIILVPLITNYRIKILFITKLEYRIVKYNKGVIILTGKNKNRYPKKPSINFYTIVTVYYLLARVFVFMRTISPT